MRRAALVAGAAAAALGPGQRTAVGLAAGGGEAFRTWALTVVAR